MLLTRLRPATVICAAATQPRFPALHSHGVNCCTASQPAWSVVPAYWTWAHGPKTRVWVTLATSRTVPACRCVCACTHSVLHPASTRSALLRCALRGPAPLRTIRPCAAAYLNNSTPADDSAGWLALCPVPALLPRPHTRES